MKITKNTIRLGLTTLSLIGIPLTSWLSVLGYKKSQGKTDKKEKIFCYAGAIASGIGTGACIIVNHRFAAHEIAALASTATFAVANRNKLEEAVKKHLPEKTEVEKKDILSDSRTIPKKISVEYTGHGNLKCFEGYSGRMFYASKEWVEQAEARLNRDLKSGIYVSMNDFYRYLNIEQTHFGNQWGWVPCEDWYENWYDDNPICFENTLREIDGEDVLIIDLYSYPMEEYMEM